MSMGHLETSFAILSPPLLQNDETHIIIGFFVVVFLVSTLTTVLASSWVRVGRNFLANLMASCCFSSWFSALQAQICFSHLAGHGMAWQSAWKERRQEKQVNFPHIITVNIISAFFFANTVLISTISLLNCMYRYTAGTNQLFRFVSKERQLVYYVVCNSIYD